MTGHKLTLDQSKNKQDYIDVPHTVYPSRPSNPSNVVQTVSDSAVLASLDIQSSQI